MVRNSTKKNKQFSSPDKCNHLVCDCKHSQPTSLLLKSVTFLNILSHHDEMTCLEKQHPRNNTTTDKTNTKQTHE